MNSECLRIADQLHRAFYGQAWHGPALGELLLSVVAEEARLHPFAGGHSIWELVLHIDVYVGAAADVFAGFPLPEIYGTDQDWPQVEDVSPERWTDTVQRLFANADRLEGAIKGFDDAKLGDIAPGRKYDFYYLLHGIVQHSLYHAGQIAILKRAIAEA